MTDPVAAVEIEGVTKRFGDVVAVDSVDLAIDDGEFFALLGPSGCGKTTTLRMIAGLDLPTEGQPPDLRHRSRDGAAGPAAGQQPSSRPTPCSPI